MHITVFLTAGQLIAQPVPEQRLRSLRDFAELAELAEKAELLEKFLPASQPLFIY